MTEIHRFIYFDGPAQLNAFPGQVNEKLRSGSLGYE
jgi:hypothetical protein